MISVCASSRCEFVGEVNKSWNVLLELAKDEKTAFSHPCRTLFGIYFHPGLRWRRASRYGDYILWGLHEGILIEGFGRVGAVQQGLRDSVFETKAKRDLVSITRCQATCQAVLLLAAIEALGFRSDLTVNP